METCICVDELMVRQKIKFRFTGAMTVECSEDRCGAEMSLEGTVTELWSDR